MKTALIILLSAALLGTAAWTRPDRRDLLLHLADRAGDGNWRSADVDTAVQTVARLEFRNRVLWTDALRDGRVEYTGVLGHWFARGNERASLPTAADVKKLLGK